MSLGDRVTVGNMSISWSVFPSTQAKIAILFSWKSTGANPLVDLEISQPLVAYLQQHLAHRC